jgi:hypothetical protein
VNQGQLGKPPQVIGEGLCTGGGVDKGLGYVLTDELVGTGGLSGLMALLGPRCPESIPEPSGRMAELRAPVEAVALLHSDVLDPKQSCHCGLVRNAVLHPA